MNDSERDRILRDSDEFRDLVEWLIKQRPDIDKETAERAIIHSGHKRIEQLFAAYIQARGENSAQLKGLVDRILKGQK